MAVTRRAELDFTLPERADLPEEVLKRFPSLQQWAQQEAERIRMLEQTLRELVTAVREDIEQPVASSTTVAAVPDSRVVTWDSIIGKPECFPACAVPGGPGGPPGEPFGFVYTVNGV